VEKNGLTENRVFRRDAVKRSKKQPATQPSEGGPSRGSAHDIAHGKDSSDGEENRVGETVEPLRDCVPTERGTSLGARTSLIHKG